MGPLPDGGGHGRSGISHHRADAEPLIILKCPAHVLAGRSVIIGDQHAQPSVLSVQMAISTSLPRPRAE